MVLPEAGEYAVGNDWPKELGEYEAGRQLRVELRTKDLTASEPSAVSLSIAILYAPRIGVATAYEKQELNRNDKKQNFFKFNRGVCINSAEREV